MIFVGWASVPFCKKRRNNGANQLVKTVSTTDSPASSFRYNQMVNAQLGKSIIHFSSIVQSETGHSFFEMI